MLCALHMAILHFMQKCVVIFLDMDGQKAHIFLVLGSSIVAASGTGSTYHKYTFYVLLYFTPQSGNISFSFS